MLNRGGRELRWLTIFGGKEWKCVGYFVMQEDLGLGEGRVGGAFGYVVWHVQHVGNEEDSLR